MASDWPNWEDDGRRIEAVFDGRIVIGTLRATDYGFDDEDEYPIWEIKDASGEHHCLGAADSWRWL